MTSKMLRVLRALRTEAGAHGDLEMVSTCDRALNGDLDAIEECQRVITDAQEMMDDD